MSPEGWDEELPYEGLRVVDLSQGVAGPHCGMLFALYGADVVKVEPPEGDWGRAIGKRYGDFSAYGIAFNRGKRSVALDLRRASSSTCGRMSLVVGRDGPSGTASAPEAAGVRIWEVRSRGRFSRARRAPWLDARHATSR